MFERDCITKGDDIMVHEKYRKTSKHSAGRPTKEEQLALENGFIELYRDGGTTIFEAGKIMGTEYETARKYYHKCVRLIADANKKNHETHFERRDRVLDMAMEGLARKIQKAIATERRLELLLLIEYRKHSALTDKGIELFEKINNAKIEEPENLKVIQSLEDTYMKGTKTFQTRIQTILAIEDRYNNVQKRITDLIEKYNVLELKPSSQDILAAELDLYLDDKKERQQYTGTDNGDDADTVVE